jgi:hypothetical protein
LIVYTLYSPLDIYVLVIYNPHKINKVKEIMMKKLVIAVALMAILFIGGAVVKDASTGQVFFTAIIWDENLIEALNLNPPIYFGTIINEIEQTGQVLSPSQICALDSGIPAQTILGDDGYSSSNWGKRKRSSDFRQDDNWGKKQRPPGWRGESEDALVGETGTRTRPPGWRTNPSRPSSWPQPSRR